MIKKNTASSALKIWRLRKGVESYSQKKRKGNREDVKSCEAINDVAGKS
jgi:hypothetical protein